MQPLTQSRARLVSKLGHNSDLIELGLETSRMVFFKNTHALRLIRSIFPLVVKNDGQEESEDEVS